MYYTETIQLNQAAGLLAKCGLFMPEEVDCTVGVFDSADDSLVAVGSRKGDMLQGIAVDPERQGEDLTGRLLTALIKETRDARSLYLFTKPEKAVLFTGLGFRLVAKARPYAALLEWGKESVRQYQKMLEAVRKEAGSQPGAVVGALVMNCNPFTKGHRYLIETAARSCDYVFVLVVEENLSRFSFQDRLELVQAGTEDLENVSVISGGRYAVSDLTFPNYFTKDDKLADAHSAMDAELFSQVIAPILGVNRRFVGTEPNSVITRIYNETLKKRLPKHGIAVVEIPRLELDDVAVSASRVRALLGIGDELSWAEIKKLVPETTYTYLQKNARQVTLTELLEARETRVAHQKELLKKYDGVLVNMTLNIPGPVKDKEIYRRALELGMKKMEIRIEREKAVGVDITGKNIILHREILHQKTGSEGYLVVNAEFFDGAAVKHIAMELEAEDEAGRVFDIDVMTKEKQFSRKDFGRTGRKCLLCGEAAKICARSQKHDMQKLVRKIDHILTVCEQ